MNRRTSLSALVGLSVLLTSLAATASPLVPLYVIYELEVEPVSETSDPFHDKMVPFVTAQKELWTELGASLDPTRKVAYRFGRDHIMFSDRPMNLETKVFTQSPGGFASLAKVSFILGLLWTKKDRENMTSLEHQTHVNRFDKWLNYAQLNVPLLVPADRVEEVLRKLPNASRV